MPATFLRPLRILHRWTGLTLGLVLVVVAVSGAALALRPRLEPIINAQLLRSAPCAVPLALDTLVDHARRQAGAAGPLAALRLSTSAGATVHVRFSDDRWFYVEPCTGAVLGSEDRYRGVFGTFDALHRFKYLPNSAMLAGSLAAAFALVLLLGGLLLWRPSPRGLRHALTLHPLRSPRGYAIGLHRTMALYAGPILLVSALSGVTQAFDWPQAALLALTGSAPGAGSGKSIPGPQKIALENAWQTALSLAPDTRDALVLLPKRAADPLRFELVDAAAPHAEARSELSIDAYSGAVLRFTPYADANTGHRLYLWLVALHTGRLGGLAGQLLLMAGALALPVLAFAGLRSYLLGRAAARSGSV